MKLYSEREFTDFYDRNSGKSFSDLEFRKCHFVNCAISITRDPRRRSKVSNVRFIDCEQHGCALETAIVEDVLIDGFKTNRLFQTWGAVFKHVVLRGKIGRLMTSPFVATGRGKSEEQKAFDEANFHYYSKADWALDISEAWFDEADLRGIPAKLIIRDPETQFILTQEKALKGIWREVDLSGTPWRIAIELFLNSGAEDEVFIAPKQNPRYRILLDGLWRLRDKGVFEER